MSTSPQQSLPTRRLGDLEVSAIGLGAMPMSVREHNDRAQAIATVHRALDEGVTLIDTADVYAPDGYAPEQHGLGHNEELVAAALHEYGGGDGVLVATKGGMTRSGADWGSDGRPEWIREAVEGSLRRLGAETIGLYQHHRPDPQVPYAETMGAFADLVEAGLVQRVGLSNASTEQIREAAAILGESLVSVQNQFSPKYRSSQPELELCQDLGVAFLPWSPLGGMSGAADLGSSFAPFAEVAERHGVTPQQVCLAWELAMSPVVVPIPGASRPETIADSVRAAHLRLEQSDLDLLNASDS